MAAAILLSVLRAAATPAPAHARIDSLHVSHRVEEAESLIAPLLVRARAEADSTFLLPLVSKLGRLRVSYGQQRAGEPLLAEAAELASALGDTLRWCDALRWLGFAVDPLGRPAEARGIYLQLQDLAKATGDRKHEAWSLVGLASRATADGFYEDAERDYRQAADIFHALGTVESEVWTLNGLAVVMDDAGRRDEALACYERVVTLARAVGYEAVEALAENNLGSLEYASGDPGLAQRHFERAMQLQTALAQHQEIILTGGNIVDCLLELGRFAEAEVLLEKLRLVCDEGALRDRESVILNLLARLRRLQGRHREATTIARRALADDGDIVGIYTRVDLLVGLAVSLAAQDSFAAALEALETGSRGWRNRVGGEAVVTLDLALGRAELEAGNPERAVATLTGVAEQSVALELVRHRFEALVLRSSAERMLARSVDVLATLGEAVQVWEDVRDAPRDPAWREMRSATGGRIAAEMIEAVLDAGTRGSAEHDIVEAFDAVQVFKARTMAERIRDRHLDAERRDERRPTTVAELQTEVLEEGEQLLDFYLGEEVSYLFAVDRSSVALVRLPPGADLEARARALRDLVATPPVTNSHEVLDRVAASLGRALFGDLAPRIEASRRLTVVPDGALNLVPFAVLSSMGKAWSRCPSATILAGLRRDHGVRGHGREILAFAAERTSDGRPLPGAVREARSLAARYEHVDLHVAGLLSPPLAESELRGRSVLHLATHAHADDERPWWSDIYLGPGRGAEGHASLRAYRIAASDFAADLVVLSACETAAGRVLSGEGVLGLSSAFLAAGSPVVVATLWPVEDHAACEFMDVFYGELSAGRTVAEALAAAGAALRGDPRTSHPFAWSAFVAVGDGAATIVIHPKKHTAASAGVLLASVAVVVLLMRRRMLNR